MQTPLVRHSKRGASGRIPSGKYVVFVLFSVTMDEASYTVIYYFFLCVVHVL